MFGLPAKALARFTPLLGKKLSEVTNAEVTDVIKTLGWGSGALTPDAIEVLDAIRRDDAGSVADLLGRPDRLAQLREALQPKASSIELVKQCRHCGQFNAYEIVLERD